MDTPGGSYTPPSTPSTNAPKSEELVRPTQPPKDPILVLVLNLLLFGGVGYIIMGQKLKGYVAIGVWILGLVNLCELEDAEGGGTNVKVKMTLTAPGCGMGPVLAHDVKQKIESLPGVKTAEVEVVFDPVWDRSMMSEAAKLQLGMMW